MHSITASEAARPVSPQKQVRVKPTDNMDITSGPAAVNTEPIAPNIGVTVTEKTALEVRIETFCEHLKSAIQTLDALIQSKDDSKTSEIDTLKQRIKQELGTFIPSMATEHKGPSAIFANTLANSYKQMGLNKDQEALLKELASETGKELAAIPKPSTGSTITQPIDDANRTPVAKKVAGQDFSTAHQLNKDAILGQEKTEHLVIGTDYEIDDCDELKEALTDLQQNPELTLTVVCQPKQGLPALVEACVIKMATDEGIDPSRVRTIRKSGTEASYDSPFNKFKVRVPGSDAKISLGEAIVSYRANQTTAEAIIDALDGFARTHITILQKAGLSNSEIINLIALDFDEKDTNLERSNEQFSSRIQDLQGQGHNIRFHGIAAMQTLLEMVHDNQDAFDPQKGFGFKQQGGYNTRCAIDFPVREHKLKETAYPDLLAIFMQTQLYNVIDRMGPDHVLQFVDPTAMLDPGLGGKPKDQAAKNIGIVTAPILYEAKTAFSKAHPTHPSASFFTAKPPENAEVFLKDIRQLQNSFSKAETDTEVALVGIKAPYYAVLKAVLNELIGEEAQTRDEIQLALGDKDFTPEQVDRINVAFDEMEARLKAHNEANPENKLKLDWKERKLAGIANSGLGQSLLGDADNALRSDCSAVAISRLHINGGGFIDYGEMSRSTEEAPRAAVWMNPGKDLLRANDANLAQKLFGYSPAAQ